MKTMTLTGGFGIEHLQVVEQPVPEPGPGQVRVRLRAASLNFRDLLMIRGLYNPRQPLPLIPCSDGAGEIEALGPGVTRFRSGDRVATCFCQGWIGGAPTRERLRRTLGGPLDGTLSEAIVLDENGVVPLPAHLSFEEGATLPCAALTAWNALHSEGGLLPGQWLLVQGTGGVSLFALQLARLVGARVIVTSSSDEKLERAAALGATHGLNYRKTPAWGPAARALTGGRGVDLVLDVGGGGTLEQSLAAMAIGGRIAVVGVLGGTRFQLDVIPLLMQAVRLHGLLVGHRDSFEAMNQALSAAALHPVIDRVFPLAQTVQAFEHLASARHVGKVVIRLD